MDNYALFAILLLALGLVLLVTEVFIPSGGLILVVALIVIGISVICAWNAWKHDEVIWWWTYIAAIVVLIPACVGGAFFVLPRTEFGRNVLVMPPKLEEVTPYMAEEERLTRMIHKTGITLSLLNPSGLVLVDDERMHCESEGMLVESEENVEVIGVKANRLVVRKVTAIKSESEVAAVDEAGTLDDPPLGFDVPQS